MQPLRTPKTAKPAAPAPPTRRRICGLLVHPAADLLPEPTPEEYARLKADIEQHGVRVPVITVQGESGMPVILDGRSRARAWEELGRDPEKLPQGSPLYSSGADHVAIVLSLNAARRHLRPEQVAALYVQAKAMGAKGTGAPKRSPAGQAVAPAIAKATGVSERTVKKVLAVAKAAPEKVKDIATGTLSTNRCSGRAADPRRGRSRRGCCTS